MENQKPKQPSTEDLMRIKLEEIREWWIGDNADWQKHFDNPRVIEWVRRDVKALFDAIDYLTLENAKLDDALKLVYNKIEEVHKAAISDTQVKSEEKE